MVLIFACDFLAEDSPAPGCNDSFGMGGCDGKTILTDVVVVPTIACLEFDVNNCNGGILDVKNTCAETFVLGGAEILPDTSASLDVLENEDGSYALLDVYSNFSDFIPDIDTQITVIGLLGEQEIEVTFTKTAPLCE